MTTDAPGSRDTGKVMALVGAIVLASQEAERHLKFLLPFTDSADPRLGSALARARKLEKRTLGELTGRLVEASTSDSLDFAGWLARLVEGRNRVVHHFSETYGSQLAAGAVDEVEASLGRLLADINRYRALAEQMSLHLLDHMRDVMFAGTPEQGEIAEFCEALRSRIQTNDPSATITVVRKRPGEEPRSA